MIMIQTIWLFNQNRTYKFRIKLKILDCSLKRQTFVNCVTVERKVFTIFLKPSY